MKKVKAAVMERPEARIRIREFDEPELEEGAALLKTIYSEVCGTDVHLWHGRLKETPYPLIPGHINVGIMEKIKGKIGDISGRKFREGDLVTFLDVHQTCHNCWFCLVAKTPTRCPYRKVYGITYGAKEGLLGGWSEKIYLKPGVKIVKLPQELTAEDFIGGGCGAPTAYHAVERADIKLGDTVVIQGSGPVGLSALAFSILAGAIKVILVGAPNLRLEMAQKFEADHIMSIERLSPSERVEKVRELTEGRGADVVIEASGNPQAVREGLEMARDNGTYVIVGQYTDAGTIQINPHLHINKKHLNIKGCWGIDFSHFYRTIQLMAKYKERFKWRELISRIYSLQKTEEALEDVENLKVVKAVIKPN